MHDACIYTGIQTANICICTHKSEEMLAIDLLHVLHLGVLRDLTGSAIRQLVTVRYWGGSTIERGLDRASRSLRDYANRRCLKLTIKRLTKANVGWASLCYPEMKVKGFDSYIILSWLNDELQRRPCGHGLDMMCTCIWSIDLWLSTCTHAGMFLTEREQTLKELLGDAFMNLYIGLAAKALADGRWLYRVRPKIHKYHHVALERRQSRYNPHMSATWMDEDWVKRTMRVKRRTHRRTATHATLNRWLLGLAAKMQLAMNKLGV